MNWETEKTRKNQHKNKHLCCYSTQQLNLPAYFVPPFLTQGHSSSWSCQLNVFAELVVGFQSLDSQSAKLNALGWRHEQDWRYQLICESWTFTQLGSHGGGLNFSSHSSTGLLEDLMVCEGKLLPNLILSVDSRIGLFEHLWDGYEEMFTNSFSAELAFEVDVPWLFLVGICWNFCHMTHNNLCFRRPKKVFNHSYMTEAICFMLWDPGGRWVVTIGSMA